MPAWPVLGVFLVRAGELGGVIRIIVTAMLALLVWAGPASARVLVVFMGAKGHPLFIREGAPAQAPK